MLAELKEHFSSGVHGLADAVSLGLQEERGPGQGRGNVMDAEDEGRGRKEEEEEGRRTVWRTERMSGSGLFRLNMIFMMIMELCSTLR